MGDEKKIVIIAIISWLVFLGVWLFVPPAEAQSLPKNLPESHCARLKHLNGKEKWKHYLWHICNKNRAKYLRLSGVVFRESRWNPRAANPSSSARGLPQFLSSWYSGRWHFDPYAPILSLRVMVYVWNRPSLGGAHNWGL